MFNLTLHTKRYGLESLITEPQMTTFSQLRAIFSNPSLWLNSIMQLGKNGVFQRRRRRLINLNVSSPQKGASSNLYETSPYEINQTFMVGFSYSDLLGIYTLQAVFN